jgi:hypothetical protein
MTLQHRLAVAIIIALGLMWAWDAPPDSPKPAPTPQGEVNLRGLFVGATAAEDAAVLAALCDEIASEIEWDGQQADPFMKTGVAFDQLRTRARVARMRGESIGERQPRVREAFDDYLTQRVGILGGAVDAGQRAKWVASYRELAEACRNALTR